MQLPARSPTLSPLAALGVVLALTLFLDAPSHVAGAAVSPPPVTVKSVTVLSSFTANVAMASTGLPVDLKSVQFTVRPLPGTTATPVSAVYTGQYLARTRRLGVPGTVTLPVFGLYPGKDNYVDIVFTEKQRTTTLLARVTTPVWLGAFRASLRTDVVARNPRVRLDYSYMLVADRVSVRRCQGWHGPCHGPPGGDSGAHFEFGLIFRGLLATCFSLFSTGQCVLTLLSRLKLCV